MPYFKDADEVYEHIGKLFEHLTQDEELSPKFRKANTIVQYQYRNPESQITVRMTEGDAPGHVRPALVKRLRDHGNCATIGGYVVRDPKLPGLAGRYLHADNCNPTIYSARLSSDGASGNRSTGLRLSRLSSFGEDALGRVYATSLNGGVYRLTPG